MNDLEGSVKDVEHHLLFATDFVGLFLPELMGWGKTLPGHPITTRGRNGFYSL